MKIVLDTNVLLTAVSRKSQNNWIIQHLIEKHFTLCVSNEILMEYAEIIERHMGKSFAVSIIPSILELQSTELVTKYYNFLLIHKDPDDDKFVDCAIACNADYIVTEDKHFKVLKTIDWPEVKAINIAEFKQLLLGKK